MKKILFLTSLFNLFTIIGFGQTTISFSAGSNNQTFSTCNGFIIDSGGQGGPGYSNNEDVTITVCPDTPGDYISVVFNLFDLNTTDDNPGQPVNVDYMYVYDGVSTAANFLGVYTNDELEGVVIQASPQNTTGCLTFRFVSNTVGTGMFSASATCETPCNDPVAGGMVVGGIANDSIHVCVGEPVQFMDNGSFAQPGFSIVSYTWDFMDGTTATGANVTHTFDIPGHYRVQLFVQDNNDDNTCVNNNLTDIDVLVATIPTFEGFPSDTTLCLGESIVMNAYPDTYEVTWDGFEGFESIDDGCLPDTLLGVAQNIDIIQTGFESGTTITNVSQIQSICLELEHSFMGDIVVYLTCPNGQNVTLHQQGGGGTQIGIPVQADNVDCTDPTTQGVPFEYCFTSSATQTWVEWVNANPGNTLPAGTYEPIEPLTDLVGCPTNGVWTLTVVDNWAADDGTLFSFGLTLDPSLYPDLVVFTPQIGLGADSSYWNTPAAFGTISTTNGDQLTIAPTASGQFTYTYSVLDNFGCFHDTSFVLTVNDNPTPFAGPDVTVCGGDPIQLNGTINGGAGSASPCTYVLDLHDTFGDGWNGNTITVVINGASSNYTIQTGADALYNLVIPHGATCSVQFNPTGNWINECEYQLFDPQGNLITQSGQNGAAPTNQAYTFTGDCFGGFEFAWSPATGLNNPAIPNPIATITDPTTYTLTIFPTGHPLCATTDEVLLSMSESANPGEDSSLVICGSAAPVDLFPLLGPQASPNGSWFGPNNQATTMPFNPATMPAGNYTYRVDSLGCVSEAIIAVQIINPSITSIVVNDASCHGSATGSAVVTAANFLTYSFNGGPFTPATSPFTLPNLATGTYSLVVQGQQGCIANQTFTVNEPDPLQLTFITPDTLICFGNSISLAAQGVGGSSTYTYTWTQNGQPVGTGQTITVTPPTVQTTYCVTLSEACGSPSVDTCMLVGNPPPIVPLLTPDTTEGCFPVAITFNNTTNSAAVASVLVDFGDGQTGVYQGLNAFNHVYTQPGVYTVSVILTSIYGCVYENEFQNMITAHDYPTANFGIVPGTVTFFDPTVQLVNFSSPDAVVFQWMIPNGTPATSGLENVTTTFPMDVEGQYPITLYVWNAANCPDTITRVANVVSDVLIYVPNTFTPDGDEFNQTWSAIMSGIDVYNYEMIVYNRWGEMVWENHDLSVGWDGTYLGRIVPAGTYVWKISAKDRITDKMYEFNGTVNVMR